MHRLKREKEGVRKRVRFLVARKWSDCSASKQKERMAGGKEKRRGLDVAPFVTGNLESSLETGSARLVCRHGVLLVYAYNLLLHRLPWKDGSPRKYYNY